MRMTKKLLSVFLSILMALSCCVAAFPTIAEAAFSGSSNTENLKAIIKFAVDLRNAGKDSFSYSSSWDSTSHEMTITDTSKYGIIYDAAYYIGLVANELKDTSGGVRSNHYSLQEDVRNATGYANDDDVKKLVDAVLHTQSTADGYYWNDGTQLGIDTAGQTCKVFDNNNNLFNTTRDWHGMGDPTSFVTHVVRNSTTGAVQSMLSYAYDTLNSSNPVPETDNTTVTITINMKRNESEEFKKTLRRRSYGWLTFSSDFSIVKSGSLQTDVATLRSFYEHYTRDRVPAGDLDEFLSSKTADYLSTELKDNQSYSNSLNGHPYTSDVYEKYFTSPTKAEIDEYMTKVALWAPRAFMKETNEKIQTQMNDLPLVPEPTDSTALRAAANAVQGWMDDIKNYPLTSSNDAWTWAVDNVGFAPDTINAYISQALYLAAKIDIEKYKAIIDPVIDAHPDQDAINAMTDDDLYKAHADVASAWASINDIVTSSGASGTKAFNELYTDGGKAVEDWLALVKQEIIDRGILDDEDELSLPETFPYPYITEVDFSSMPSDEIYNNHLSKEQTWKDLVEKYGEERLKNFFAKQQPDIEGYGDTVYGAIEDYFQRARDELTKRITEDLDHIQNLAPDDKVGLGNYKDIISSYDNQTEWNIYNKYLTPDATLQQKKAKADELYNKAKNFANNIWSTDLNSWVPRTIDWPVREAKTADLGRATSPVNETYATSWEKTRDTLNVLDEFLLSNDLGGLLNLTDSEGNKIENLSQLLNNLLDGNLFTDQMINTIVNMLYPLIDSQLDTTIRNVELPGILFWLKNTDILDQLYSGLEAGDIYVYPTKLANYLNTDPRYAGKYNEVVAALLDGPREGRDTDRWAFVGGHGDSPNWEKPDGLPLDTSWGVDAAQGYEAKKTAFTNALSAALSGLTPLLRALLTTYKIDDLRVLGGIGYGAISAVDGYNSAILPLLEAIGIADYMPSVAEYRGYTTSEQLIGGLLNGIFDWIDNKLMKSPVETIINMLPNLIYTLNRPADDGAPSMVMSWLQKLRVSIGIQIFHVEAFEIKITELVVSDLLADTLGTHTLNSLNDILALVKEKADIPALQYLDFTQDEEATFASCGQLKNNLKSGVDGGVRLGVEPDGAKMLYTLLNYVFTHIDTILQVVQGFMAQPEEPPAEGSDSGIAGVLDMLQPVFDNMKTDPDGVFTALIELFQPYRADENSEAGYKAIPYTWWGWKTADSDSSKPTQGASNYIYLRYGNDWSYEKAKTLYDRIDDIVNIFLTTVLEEKGYADVGQLLEAVIQEMFSNDSITSIVKLLTQIGSVASNETLAFLTSRIGQGVDLGIWAEEYAYLFVDENTDTSAEGYVAPLKPGDSGYDEQNDKLNRLTAKANAAQTEEDKAKGKNAYIWYLDGNELKNDDQETFAAIVSYLMNELSPLVDLFLAGSDLTLFDGTLTLTGYEGYDTAIIPLLEAFGVTADDNMVSQEEFASQNNKIEYLVNLIFDYVAKVLTPVEAGEGVEAFSPIKNLIANILPSLIYFLQSNGLSTVLLNLLHPITTLWDTVSPIISGLTIETGNETLGTLVINDLNTLLSGLLTNLVRGIFPNADIKSLDLKNLSLHAIAAVGAEITGLNLTPLVYGIDAICSIDRKEVDSVSKTFDKRYTFADSGDGATELNDPANVVTIVLSLVLDLVMTKGNAKIIDGLLADTLGDRAGIVETIRDALRGVGIDPSSLGTINWFYFDPTYNPLDEPDKYIPTGDVVGKVDTPPRTNFYIRYANDLEVTDNMWTQEFAAFLDSSLVSLVDYVLSQVDINGTKYATLGELLNGLLKDNQIFTDRTINRIAAALRDLLANLNTDNGGIVNKVSDLVNIFFGADVNHWSEKNYPEIAPEEAKELSNEEFATALANLLVPLDGGYKDDTKTAVNGGILSWLLTGKDYKFFYTSEEGADPEDMIVIKGGNGFNTAIIPLLEALGCTVPELVDNDSGIEALYKTVLALLNRKDALLAAPLDELLNAIPNVIYFLNANGLSTCLLNLLNPVVQLANAVLPKVLPDAANYNDVVAFLEDFIQQSLGVKIPVSHLDLEAILDLVKGLTADEEKNLPGLDINKAVTLKFAQEGEDEYNYNYLTNFYIGELTRFQSANGEYAYKMGFGSYDPETPAYREARSDFLTILIYTVFDILNDQDCMTTIKGLINDENVSKILDGVLSLLKTTVSGYEGMDWFYFESDPQAALEAAKQAATGAEYKVDTEHSTMSYVMNTYLSYGNDWNKDTAAQFKAVFYDLVDTLVKLIVTDGSMDEGLNATLKALWDSLWGKTSPEDAMFTQSMLNALNDKIYSALVDLKIGDIAVLDLLDALDIHIEASKARPDDNKPFESYEDFAAALSKTFEPFGKLLDWLLVGEDKALAFFFTSDNQDAIRIGGGDGYESAIVPILEALGCDPATLKLEDGASGTDALTKAVTALLNMLDEAFNSENVLQAIVTKIPNLLYFINANGLSVAVRNLLAPVSAVLTAASGIAGSELTLQSLIDSFLPEGVELDITNLNLEAILTLVEGLVSGGENGDLHIFDAIKDPKTGDNYLADFALGKIVKKDSASKEGFRFVMECKGEDVFTVLLCTALDVLKYEGNAEFFTKTFGDDVYTIIKTVFDLGRLEAKYVDYNWAYFADFQKLVENLPNGGTIQNTNHYIRYAKDKDLPNNLWSEKLAEFLDASINSIVNMVIQSVTGEEGATLQTFLANSFSIESLYTKENIQAIVDALAGVLPEEIKEFEDLLNIFLGVDLSKYENYQFVNGDKETYTQEEFAKELANVLAPLGRVLDWLLLGKEYAFFTSVNDENNDGRPDDQIVLPGGNGYVEGLAPLLEAFYITPPAVDEQTTSITLIEDVINAVLGKVTDVLKDEKVLDRVLGIIPNLIYFTNANGIAVSVVNLLSPVVELAGKVLSLDALKGALGDIQIPTIENEDGSTSVDPLGLINALLGMIDLSQYNITLTVDSLNFKGICKIIEGVTGSMYDPNDPSQLAYDDTPVPGLDIYSAVTMEDGFNYIDNFYIGKIEKYTSIGGKEMFRMSFSDAEGARADRSDLITILLYTLFDVIYQEGNQKFLCKALFANDKPTLDMLLNLLRTSISDYEATDWFYFADSEEQKAAIREEIAQNGKYVVDPANTSMGYLLETYLQYDENNIWNENTAAVFEENFYKIVDMIVGLIDKDAGSANAYLKNLWDGANLYTEKNVYAVGAAIYKALARVAENKLMDGLTVGDLLEQLDVDLKSLEKYTKEPSKKTYETADDFAKALAEVFEPLDLVLDWLLTGKSIGIFFTADNQNAIELAGGNGYANAIAPILEALGCEPKKLGEKASGHDAIAAAISAVLDLVDRVVNSENAVKTVIDLLPNILYFINAKGLSKAVQNLVKPVDAVLQQVAMIAGEGSEYLGSVEGLLNELLKLEDQYGIKSIYNIDLTAVCNIVTANVEGLNIIPAISLPVLDENGQPTDKYQPSYLEDFAVGEIVPYDSISDFDATFKMQFSEDERAIDKVDLFTVLICTVLDLFKYPGNKDFLVNTLFGGGEEGAKSYDAVMALLDSELNPVYRDYDWFYFDKSVSAGNFPNVGDKVTVSYDKSTMGYLSYNNLWNENTKVYIEKNFYDIVDLIISSTTDYATLEDFIHTEWSGLNLYNEKNVYAVGKLVGEALGGLDEMLQTVVGVVLGIDASAWDIYIDTDPDKVDEPLSREAFIEQLVNIFAPAKNILDWLLVGEEKSLDIFYSKDGSAGITIGGANGFLEGIVPLIEAFGIRLTEKEVKAASTDSLEAVKLTANKLLGLIDSIGVESNPTTVENLIALIPNLVYFINANGLSVSVNNLILPIVNVLDAVSGITGEDYSDLGKLLGLDKYGVDLDNLDIVSVFNIVQKALGININDPVTYNGVNLYEYLAIGEVEKFTSANGKPAYCMHYADDAAALDAVDMLTILVATIVEVFAYEPNKDAIVELLGDENIYNVINHVLSLKVESGKYPYMQFRWLFTKNNYTEIADEYKDVVFSPMYGQTHNFDYGYDQYWTQEKADYINKNLPAFVDGLMHLLGIQFDGITLDNLGDLLNDLIGTSLYTPDLMNKLASELAKLVDKINGLAPAGSTIKITDAIEAALGTDLTVYYKYNTEPFTFEVGDKDAFVNAFVKLMRPLYPLFKVVLAGEDLAIFTGKEGKDLVVIPGGNGYGEGVVPLLEALDRDLPIVTQEQYVADIAKDEDNLVLDIVNPILTFLDYVLEDPLNRIVDVLPGVIYYVNSLGLDSSFKNALHPVYMVLTAIEPLVKVDLYDALGFHLDEMDFDYFYSMLISKLSSEYSVILKPLIGSAVEELSLGKVVKYQSKSGHTAFTMEYAGSNELASESDMITTILRLILKWIVMEENRETIRGLIRDYTGENADYVLALYDTFVKYAAMPHGINMIMGLLYYIFYGVDKAVSGANQWLGDVNSKWKFVMDLFDHTQSDYLGDFGKLLKGLMNKYTGDVIDPNGLASNGLIAFFQKIINWIKSLINTIRSLFNIG